MITFIALLPWISMPFLPKVWALLGHLLVLRWVRLSKNSTLHPLARLGVLLSIGVLLPAPLSTWPIPPILALLALFGAEQIWPTSLPRPTIGAFQPGLALLTAGIAIGALGAWISLADPNMDDLVGLLPQNGLLLLAVGVVFPLANACAEEGVFRLVVQNAITKSLGARWAIFVQALVFGAFHVHGFPRGTAGIILASIFGLMQGALVHRCQGLGTAVAAHVLINGAMVLWLTAANPG